MPCRMAELLTIGVETVLIDDDYLEAHPDAHIGKFIHLHRLPTRAPAWMQ